MNRGRFRRVLPNLQDAKVEFVKAEPLKNKADTWVVTVSINGWPHDLRMHVQDELGAMKNVFAMQRGEKPYDVFEISK